MRTLVTCTIALLLLVSVNAQLEPSEEKKLDDLLKQMTLEEKVGQMTQVTFAVIAKGGWADTEGEIDPAALKKAILDDHVGSILNANAQMKTITEPGDFEVMIGDKKAKFFYK